VVLGAGYDMRAFRFAAAIGRRPVFEVDYPSTASRKARVLSARAADLSPVDVRRVSIDFQTQTLDAVLRGAGFVPGRPTFFLWEGVSMYLRRAAVQDTLRSLAALGGPGSELVMDYWSLLDTPDLRATAHRMSAGLLHFISEPVTFALHPEDGPDFVRRLGWEAVEILDSAALKAAYVQDDRGMYPAMWCLHARIRS
jgi:methyltransferase (TIGR00027 family)